MEFALRAAVDADLEIPSADFSEIRFLRLPKVAHITPQSDFPVEDAQNPVGNWRTATTEQAEDAWTRAVLHYVDGQLAACAR